MKKTKRRLSVIVLLLLLMSVTIGYSALSSSLNITGTSKISNAKWDVHFADVSVTTGSVTATTAPTIDATGLNITYAVNLTTPGDFYEFTIDVVNNGSIDAMIDSVTKTPTLSETQAKYLNYIVEYQNGESINTKQLVEANSFVRLKVKVEFRKDLVASDLPTSTETLNLAFTVNYVQASETGTTIVPDNGVKKVVKLLI